MSVISRLAVTETVSPAKTGYRHIQDMYNLKDCEIDDDFDRYEYSNTDPDSDNMPDELPEIVLDQDSDKKENKYDDELQKRFDNLNSFSIGQNNSHQQVPYEIQKQLDIQQNLQRQLQQQQQQIQQLQQTKQNHTENKIDPVVDVESMDEDDAEAYRHLNLEHFQIFRELKKMFYDKEEDFCNREVIEHLYDNLIHQGKDLIIENTNKKYEMTITPLVLKKFTWVKIVKFRNIGLEKLTCLPPNVERVFLEGNKIVSIAKDALVDGITRLSLRNNSLKTIDFANFPSTLERLDLGSNIIVTINNSNALSNLVVLGLDDNSLDSIPIFNSNLSKLSISGNRITSLKNCTPNLVDLDCSDNIIENLKIDDLPPKLETLIAYRNKIRFIITLAKTVLKHVDISNNALTYFGSMSPVIEKMDLSNNQLKNLQSSVIPLSLKELDLRGNCIQPKDLIALENKNAHIIRFVSDNDRGDTNLHGNDSDDNDEYERKWYQTGRPYTINGQQVGYNHGNENKQGQQGRRHGNHHPGRDFGNPLGNNNYSNNYYNHAEAWNKYNNMRNQNTSSYTSEMVSSSENYMSSNTSNPYHITPTKVLKMSRNKKYKTKN